MPYCPKCDMEFVDGITICSDCKGPLVESKEAALEQKRLEELQKQQELAKQRLAQAELLRQELDQQGLSEHAADKCFTDPEDAVPEDMEYKSSEKPIPGHVFVKKEQKYDDLKSSSSAFFGVGLVLLAGSIACWSGIIPIPLTGFHRILILSALTLMGIFALTVAVKAAGDAKKLAPQIADENRRTQELIQWFLDSYSPKDLDCDIPNSSELAPEELSLKRFQLIQDLLITHHDLPDPAYVDLLCEEIYSRLFES